LVQEELADSSRVPIGAPEQMEYQVQLLFRATHTQPREEAVAAAVWMVTTGNRGDRGAAEPLVETWEPEAPPAARAFQDLLCMQMEGRRALATVEVAEGQVARVHPITVGQEEAFGASCLPVVVAAGETELEALQ